MLFGFFAIHPAHPHLFERQRETNYDVAANALPSMCQRIALAAVRQPTPRFRLRIQGACCEVPPEVAPYSPRPGFEIAFAMVTKACCLRGLGHRRFIGNIGNSFAAESIEDQGSTGITEYIDRGPAHIHKAIHPGNNRDRFHGKLHRRQDDR